MADIHRLVAEHAPSGTLCDPFAGIGTVGSYFKQHGYKVSTGDSLRFAHYYQIARVNVNRRPRFLRLERALGLAGVADVVQHLNSLRGRGGWITKHYSEERGFFLPSNARRIDAIWREIRNWKIDGLVSDTEEAVLTASLIQSVDKIANTAGTYYAYLKQWYRKALKPFRFELLLPAKGTYSGQCFHMDALPLVLSQAFDVLYLDPPYNQRSYGGYYHLPESIALGYAGPVDGSAGIPSRAIERSRFCVARHAADALEELVTRARYRLLVVHYSDDGLIERKSMRRILKQCGRLTEHVVQALGYSTTDSRRTLHRVYVVQA